MEYAARIQSRAVKRLGELSRQIPTAKGKRTDVEPPPGTEDRSSKSEILKDAGVSRQQAERAENVAAIPDADFDYAVESQDPPTVTALAECKLRAEIRAGELLQDMSLNGGDRKSESHDARVKLADVGISAHESSRFQAAASALRVA